MFTYYGWLSINDSTYESDATELNLAISKISAFIKEHELDNTSGFIKVHHVNGEIQLLMSGCRNHLSQEIEDIFALYQFVADVAVGSYGLLYTWDEGSPDAYNEFEVLVLARGKLRKERDQFLSPCIPIIEDGEPGF